VKLRKLIKAEHVESVLKLRTGLQNFNVEFFAIVLYKK